MPDQTTTIDLLRHGACEGGEIYRGTTDVKLSGEGLRQMTRAIARPAAWQCIVSSPLLRCRDFAQSTASRLGVPLKVAADFREMDFGEWEGRLVSDVWRDDRQQAERFFADPREATPPGGEPVNEVVTRISAGWDALLSEHTGGTLLLVSHGGVMRILLSHLLGMPLNAITRLHVPYACMARVQIVHRPEGDVPVLVSLNRDPGR